MRERAEGVQDGVRGEDGAGPSGAHRGSQDDSVIRTETLTRQAAGATRPPCMAVGDQRPPPAWLWAEQEPRALIHGQCQAAASGPALSLPRPRCSAGLDALSQPLVRSAGGCWDFHFPPEISSLRLSLLPGGSLHFATLRAHSRPRGRRPQPWVQGPQVPCLGEPHGCRAELPSGPSGHTPPRDSCPVSAGVSWGPGSWLPRSPAAARVGVPPHLSLAQGPGESFPLVHVGGK